MSIQHVEISDSFPCQKQLVNIIHILPFNIKRLLVSCLQLRLQNQEISTKCMMLTMKIFFKKNEKTTHILYMSLINFCMQQICIDIQQRGHNYKATTYQTSLSTGTVLYTINRHYQYQISKRSNFFMHFSIDECIHIY